MTSGGNDASDGTHDAVLARVRALTAGIRDGAAAAEEARTVPQETIDKLLAAGISRILIPPQYGAMGSASTPGSKSCVKSATPTRRMPGARA